MLKPVAGWNRFLFVFKRLRMYSIDFGSIIILSACGMNETFFFSIKFICGTNWLFCGTNWLFCGTPNKKSIELVRCISAFLWVRCPKEIEPNRIIWNKIEQSWLGLVRLSPEIELWAKLIQKKRVWSFRTRNNLKLAYFNCFHKNVILIITMYYCTWQRMCAMTYFKLNGFWCHFLLWFVSGLHVENG